MSDTYTTNSKNGFVIKIKPGQTELVGGVGGKVKVKTMKPAVWAKLNFMEKFDLKKEAEKLGVPVELLRKVLIEAEKTSPVLWTWAKRPVEKVKRLLEDENDRLKEENSSLKKQLEALRKSK
jgi:hypothetical protein